MQYEAEFLKIAVVDDEPLWQQKTVDVIEKKYGLDADSIYAKVKAFVAE